MAEANNGGSNVAIIALIIIAVLVAGAAFLYMRDKPAEAPAQESGQSGQPPSVIERNNNTVIERETPAPAAPPAEPEPPADSSTTIEHQQDGQGSETTIQHEQN